MNTDKNTALYEKMAAEQGQVPGLAGKASPRRKF